MLVHGLTTVIGLLLLAGCSKSTDRPFEVFSCGAAVGACNYQMVFDSKLKGTQAPCADEIYIELERNCGTLELMSTHAGARKWLEEIRSKQLEAGEAP